MKLSQHFSLLFGAVLGGCSLLAQVAAKKPSEKAIALRVILWATLTCNLSSETRCALVGAFLAQISQYLIHF